MHEGDDINNGTAGPAVVIASNGRDIILLQRLGGADLVCAGDGDDAIIVAGPNSKVDDGTGQDGINASSAASPAAATATTPSRSPAPAPAPRVTAAATPSRSP